MKNKFIIIFFLILLSSTLSKSIMAEEFIFEVNTLEITDNGNIYKGKNRGKIIANTQLELLSDNFEYFKKTNKLKAYGNVQLYDIKNNITMNKIEECIHKSNLKLRPLLRNLLEIDPSKRITIKECMRIFKGEFDFIDKILLN